MWKPIYQPEPWPQFVKRKDIIGLPLMEQRRKFMEEQVLFENYVSSINTVNTVSTAAAGAAGGSSPSTGGGGGGGFTALTDANFNTAIALWFSDQAAAEAEYGLIGEWNTTGVTDMTSTFSGEPSFNEDIGAWDTSNVTSMRLMFANSSAWAFNQDISGWDVSSVIDMSYMFYGNDAGFNVDISGWDVSSVTDMRAMFQGCSQFNQPVGNWTTTNLELVDYMFFNAEAFDQDLSNWDVGNLTSADVFLVNALSFSTTNYDALLIGWAAQTVQPNVEFVAPTTDYSAGAAATARGVLTSAPNNWTITDGGQAP